MKIKTLVLPVAGMGKRLRPLTLTTSKNLVLVHGKPLIEYTLSEAEKSGIEEVILIVGPQHRKQFEAYLRKSRKQFPGFAFRIRVQDKPFGNGHALLMAADLLKNRPFAIRFPDDIILHEPPVLSLLINLFEKYKAPVLLLKKIPKQKVVRYGVVKAKQVTREVYRIFDFVEKPKVEDAPSNLIVIGGYVVTPSIMGNLKKLSKFMPKVDDGLLLTDALKMEVRKGKPLYGFKFPGIRLDCGTLDGLRDAEEFLS